MSLLTQIRKISNQKTNCFTENHLFVEESLEFRLRYLSAIALGIAIDRTPKKSEIQAFLGLASNLSVEKADADEQFSERNSLTEADILVLFEALNDKNANLQYIIDLAWIHAVDGLLDENEKSTIEHVSHLLRIDLSLAQEIHSFMALLKNANYTDLYSSIRNLFGDKIVRNHLIPILKRFIPYQDFVYNRWIDHGDNEITDCATGITWSRTYIGDKFENGEFHGHPKQIIRCFGENIYKHASEIENAIEQFSLSSAPIKDWRVPTKNEFCQIIELGYFEKLFNASGLKKNTITNDNNCYDSLMGLSYGEYFHILLIRENVSWLQNTINSLEDDESETAFRLLKEAIQNNTLRSNLSLLKNAWDFEDSHQLIKTIVNTSFPFRTIFENRWIEHNDNLATDMNTGMTWFRKDSIGIVELLFMPVDFYRIGEWWNPFSWGEKETILATGFNFEKLISDLGLEFENWHAPFSSEFENSYPFPRELFDYCAIELYPYNDRHDGHRSNPIFAENCDKKAIILCTEFEKVEF